MIKGINHITFSVSDLDLSLRFYRDLLGMKSVVEWDSGAYLEAGNLWLCLSLGNALPSSDYSHIAFTVDEQGLQKLKSMLSDGLLKVWQQNASEGESLYIVDPDNHKLELHIGSLDTRLQALRKSPYSGLVWSEI